jgi:DNA-binding transcriptional LysR family regulator
MLLRHARYLCESHPYAKRRRAITLEDFNRDALVLLNTEFATRVQIDRIAGSWERRRASRSR